MAGIGIDIGIDDSVEEAIRDFGKISAKVKSKAIVRGANKAVRKVRTEAGREVRRRYYITVRAVRKTSWLKLAGSRGSRTIEAAVTFRGARLPVTDFSARPVNAWNVPGRKHKKRGGGVRVRIKRSSGAKLIEGAFIATARSGKVLAFRRKGRARYPIEALQTIAIPQAVGQEVVFSALRRHGIDTFNKEFIRQLNLLVRTT